MPVFAITPVGSYVEQWTHSGQFFSPKRSQAAVSTSLEDVSEGLDREKSTTNAIHNAYGTPAPILCF